MASTSWWVPGFNQTTVLLLSYSLFCHHQIDWSLLTVLNWILKNKKNIKISIQINVSLAQIVYPTTEYIFFSPNTKKNFHSIGYYFLFFFLGQIWPKIIFKKRIIPIHKATYVFKDNSKMAENIFWSMLSIVFLSFMMANGRIYWWWWVGGRERKNYSLI